MITALLVAAAVAAAPADPAMLSDAARAIEAGRLEQARTMIGRAVAAGAGGPQVERLLADLAFASGKDAEALPWSLETGALCGTPARVAEQVAELRDAGAHHVLCQMSFGYLPHERIMASMREFGDSVMPRFR